MAAKKSRDDAADELRDEQMDEGMDGASAVSDGRERRQWQRVLVDIEVDYGNQDNYLFAYIRDISATGIFVRTNSPEEPGTRLNLRFAPNEDSDHLELEGEVIWWNPYRPGAADNLHPGMGIRFIGLTDGERRQLSEFIKTFAYLSDDSE